MRAVRVGTLRPGETGGAVNRGERNGAILAVVLTAAVALAIVVGAHWFAGSTYSNSASNVLGIIGGPSLLIALAMGMWIRWHRTCKVPWCLRLGEHPVKGTTVKVCTRHHTVEHHRALHELHQVEGRLGWGESHDD